MSIEQEIQAKGLTAPRVTPADIEAAIDSHWFFTAAEGCEGAAAAGTPYADQPPVGAQSPLRLLTFCVLVMKNGFTVVGKSACASPENFDAEMGKKIARQDAINQCWPLLGYELRSKLASAPPPPKYTLRDLVKVDTDRNFMNDTLAIVATMSDGNKFSFELHSSLVGSERELYAACVDKANAMYPARKA